MTLGINLSFAVKRWPEPERWAALVREELGLTHLQFSFDLLDPWWPDELAVPLARRVRQATERHGLSLDSAFVGLAAYSYNGLLHPEKEGREAAERWLTRACDLAAELGARAVGGPLGGMSVGDAALPTRRSFLLDEAVERVGRVCEHARAAGLSAFLIEPTPLPREVPHTPGEALDLAERLKGAALPVRFVLDLGHALYRPLYGAAARLEPWLDALGPALDALHLQQTDGEGDRHWGFGERGFGERAGLVDLPDLRAQLAARGLAELPVVLELFYPFEQADDEVLRDVKRSVQLCREVWPPRVKA